MKQMSYVRTAPVGASPLLLSQTAGLLTKAAGPTTKVFPTAGVPGVVGGVMDYVRQNPLLVLGGVALLAILVSKKKK